MLENLSTALFWGIIGTGAILFFLNRTPTRREAETEDLFIHAKTFDDDHTCESVEQAEHLVEKSYKHEGDQLQRDMNRKPCGLGGYVYCSRHCVHFQKAEVELHRWYPSRSYVQISATLTPPRCKLWAVTDER